MYINNENSLFKGEKVELPLPAIKSRWSRWIQFYQVFDNPWYDGEEWTFTLTDGISESLTLEISDTPDENQIGSYSYWITLSISQPYGVWAFIRLTQLITRNKPNWLADLSFSIEGGAPGPDGLPKPATLRLQWFRGTGVWTINNNAGNPVTITTQDNYFSILPPADVISNLGETRVKLTIQRQRTGVITCPPLMFASGNKWGTLYTEDAQWDTIGEMIKRPKQGQTNISLLSDEIIQSIHWEEKSPISAIAKNNWTDPAGSTSYSIANEWGTVIRIICSYETKTDDPLLKWINTPVGTNPFRDFTLYPFTRMDLNQWYSQQSWNDFYPIFNKHQGFPLYNVIVELANASLYDGDFVTGFNRLTGRLSFIYSKLWEINDEIRLNIDGDEVILICGIDFQPFDDLRALLDTNFGLAPGTWQKWGVYGRELYYYKHVSFLDTDAVVSVTDRGNWGETIPAIEDYFGGWQTVIRSNPTPVTYANAFNHSLKRYPRWVNPTGEICISHLVTIIGDHFDPPFTPFTFTKTNINVYSDTGRLLSQETKTVKHSFTETPQIHQQFHTINYAGNINSTDRTVWVTANLTSDVQSVPYQIPMVEELWLRGGMLYSFLLFRNSIGGWEQVPLIKADRTETENRDAEFRGWKQSQLEDGAISNIVLDDWNPTQSTTTQWQFYCPMTGLDAGEWTRRQIQKASKIILRNRDDLTPFLNSSFAPETILIEECETQWDPVNLMLIIKGISR